MAMKEAQVEQGEHVQLLTTSGPKTHPVMQPPEKPSDPLFCLPWLPCLPLATLVFYALMVLCLVVVASLSVVAGVLCFLPMAGFWSWTWFWKYCPIHWQSDLYEKMIYLSYYGLNAGAPLPKANTHFMPVADMKPRAVLEKYYMDYALNIQVPKGSEDQFLKEFISPEIAANFIEHRLHWWVMTDRFDEFGPDDNPVEFAMKQLSAVYPQVYQSWPDKHSDQALTRFCLQGLGAHRVEVEERENTKYFVVRTNALAGLPVRDGFERYGGDAYFDDKWRPVMIIDHGLTPVDRDFAQDHPPKITRPGDADWDRAKFRFRSSLFALVTLVDHLYGIHLQTANLFVTALREQMSADHPIRRFMTPFTYQTISINDNAKHNLVAPRSMGPRCFALTDKGLSLAFAAAPSLLVTGHEVGGSQGGPILDLKKYFQHLKKQGIQTEYWRQAEELFEIYERFLSNYLSCYYPSKEALVKDPELIAMAKHYFSRLEAASAESLSRIRAPFITTVDQSIDVNQAWEFYVHWLASIMWVVTAGHEQQGAVEVYAQDASWTAFKWTPGRTMGTKQTATAQALLMSFTSTPMPKLLGEDWSFLFPEPWVPSAQTPKSVFQGFQSELLAMAERCDKYNELAPTRAFPDCFPVYTCNPRVLETSVSV
mmetsp:Transcript_76798/g.183983  ORF Transcript_76798/g.183983 Transcript_76798/m.183983 type:complete len:652 (-) Transcript_76798:75-2030(-)